MIAQNIFTPKNNNQADYWGSLSGEGSLANQALFVYSSGPLSDLFSLPASADLPILQLELHGSCPGSMPLRPPPGQLGNYFSNLEMPIESS